MKRYIAYAGIALMAMSAASCAKMEQEPASPAKTVTVVGRVTSFANANVSTKGNKVGDEKKLSNMTMFVIDGNGHVVNVPEYQSGDSEYIFTIDRDDYKEGHDQSALAHSSIYIFANIPDSRKDELTGIRSLDDLLNLDIPVSGIAEPELGFPMIGHLDIDLSQTSTETGEKQIPLNALYAKVVFNINVAPIQYNPSVTQRFMLKKWSVHNVPNAVRAGAPANNAETVHVNDMQSGTFLSTEFTGSNPVSSAHTLSFSFYVPEHKINPTGTVTYPFEDIPANQEFKQRFKPALVNHGSEDEQNATYVEINGDYFDHNGRRHDMTYTIYLGGNNYDDFYILRDHQYNNYIEIRGVNDSTSEDDQTISYDWRVNKEQTEYKFELERETLLDSHWEIRPIHITLNAAEHPGAKIVVSIKNPSTANWLRMEMPSNPGGSAYCTQDETALAYGKRKYFTTDLVTNTLRNNTSVTINADYTKAEHTIWMYIDEYADLSAGNVSRQATVECKYYDKASDEVPQITREYAFIQKNIHSVEYDGKKYFIEYYEEYLYNFDSNDKFGSLTDGMEWGLDGEKVSFNDIALYATGFFGDLTNNILHPTLSSKRYFYDFYLTKDLKSGMNVTESAIHDHDGHLFTQRVMEGTGRSGDNSTLATDHTPSSAIEYCVNKNKRLSDGSTLGQVDLEAMNWYLPGIDEIEDICKGGYSEFEVFQDKYYWSSQPAYSVWYWKYDAHAAFGLGNTSGYMCIDNPARARATKVDNSFNTVNSGETGNMETQVLIETNYGRNPRISEPEPYQGKPTYEAGNQPRTKINRVRCVYRAPTAD